MAETGTDEQSPAREVASDAEPTPAATAADVAAMASRNLAINAGSLQVWGRVAGRPRRSWLARLTHFVAWCVTLLLFALAGLRIGCHDAAVRLIWLNAFTLYVYLPAYVILAIAIGRQRWRLAVASAVVVACHVVWVAPDFQPATPYALPSAAASQPVRIFYANVRGTNQNSDGILEEIANADPDVVVLVEVHRAWFKSLINADAMKPFVHGTTLGGPFPGEVMVFSKLPVLRQHQRWPVQRICNLVDIPLASQSLRLFCLHSPRPLDEPSNRYYTYWEKLLTILAEQPLPLVVIGDFNATQHSLVYERLTSMGLRSAHVDRGRGYATTWPNGEHRLPPIRIDQALVSPGVECLSIAEGIGAGSDHKPLILDIRVHPHQPRRSVPAAGG